METLKLRTEELCALWYVRYSQWLMAAAVHLLAGPAVKPSGILQASCSTQPFLKLDQIKSKSNKSSKLTAS